MKALISAAFAAAFLLSDPALADGAKPADQNQPVQLTAAQMDTVTAGAGRIDKAPQKGGGVPPWSALFAAGHVNNLLEAGGVTVRVPDSVLNAVPE